MSSDLIDKVRQEIEKTGFPLELRVAEELRQRHYPVAHNVYFLDRDEGKGREVDLRGLKNIFFTKGGKGYTVRHCILVECKKSASRPWVIFTSPSVSYDQNVFDLHCVGARRPIWNVSPDDYRRLQDSHPWLAPPHRGRSFFEPFSGGQEANQTIFKALLSVVKASIEVRRSGFGAGGTHRGRRPTICFYYPIVVLDGILYVARLDSGGLVVQEAESLPVSLYYRSSAYDEDERYTVLVVREAALRSELEKLESWLSGCADHLKANIGVFETIHHRIVEPRTPNKNLQPRKARGLAAKRPTSDTRPRG